jgi:hypothetical protein
MSDTRPKPSPQPHSSAETSLPLDSLQGRLFELEYENTRLQRLVTELLFKNQQLRCTP